MKIGAFLWPAPKAYGQRLWPAFDDHGQNKTDGNSRNNLYVGFLLPVENVKR